MTASERRAVAALRSAARDGLPVGPVPTDPGRGARGAAEERGGGAADIPDLPDLPILNPAMRQRLIQARCARKLNQQALANATNLRLQVIQDLETGKPVAQPGVLQKLSKVLGSDLKLRFGKDARVPAI